MKKNVIKKFILNKLKKNKINNFNLKMKFLFWYINQWECDSGFGSIKGLLCSR